LPPVTFRFLRQLPEREAVPVTIELGQHVEFCERQAELGVQHRIERGEQLAMQRQQLQPEPGFDLPRDGNDVLFECCRHCMTIEDKMSRQLEGLSRIFRSD
jgi:hypothetical protein